MISVVNHDASVCGYPQPMVFILQDGLNEIAAQSVLYRVVSETDSVKTAEPGLRAYPEVAAAVMIGTGGGR